jgi:hypothetical protein
MLYNILLLKQYHHYLFLLTSMSSIGYVPGPSIICVDCDVPADALFAF